LADAKHEKPKPAPAPQAPKPKPEPKLEVAAAAPPDCLANLLSAPVETVDMVAAQAEADRIRVQGAEAAKVLAQLDKEIESAQSAMKGADETLRNLIEPGLNANLKRRAAILAAIGGNAHLEGQTKLALLIDKVRACPTARHEDAVKLVDEAIASGRCYAPSYAETQKARETGRVGKLWCWDRMIFFKLEADGKLNKANEALYAEFKRLFSKVAEEHRHYIQLSGSDDLSGLEKGVSGLYTLVSPAYRFGKVSVPDGGLLVQVEVIEKNGRQDFVKIHFLDAYGSLRWIVENERRKFVPWFWFEKNRVFRAKDPKTGQLIQMPEQDFRHAIGVLNTLRWLVDYWKVQNVRKVAAVAAKQALEAKSESAPEQIVRTPMPEPVVETASAPEPAAPPKADKPKKAKKQPKPKAEATV
jgi:hypothetical protein